MTQYQTRDQRLPRPRRRAERRRCTDLTGQPLKELSADANDSVGSAEVIAAADCAQVDVDDPGHAAATSTRPSSATGSQMLEPGVEAGCGDGITTRDRLHGGLRGRPRRLDAGRGERLRRSRRSTGRPPRRTRWRSRSATATPARSPSVRLPTRVTARVRRPTSAAPTTSTSPDIAVPAGASGPRLSFDHYVVTELGFDGGNVQISVDGGDVRADPGRRLRRERAGRASTSEPEGNTNPLAGAGRLHRHQPGPRVRQLGHLRGRPRRAGRRPGDTVQLRFAIGRDGCGAGVDGPAGTSTTSSSRRCRPIRARRAPTPRP